MDEWLGVLAATAAVFGVVGVGGVLRKAEWLTAEADASLLKIVVRVLVPALIVKSMLGNPALDRGVNIWLPPLVGFGTTSAAILVSALVAWWAGPWVGLTTPRARRTFALSVGLHNYGYLAIPLAESLYGQGNPVLGVLFVNNVGVDLAMWTLGVAMVSGALGWSGLKRMANAPSIAVLVALALHLMHAHEWMPGFVLRIVAMLGVCAVPVALLLIGATMMDAFTQLDADQDEASTAATKEPRARWGMMSLACLLRLGILPAGFIAVAWALTGMGASLEMQRVLLLHAAMPAAVFPIVLARHYGGDPGVAARISLATSAVSLITMPAWLALCASWFSST